MLTRARQLPRADLQARTGLTCQTTGGGSGQSGHWTEAESGPSVCVCVCVRVIVRERVCLMTSNCGPDRKMEMFTDNQRASLFL